MEPLAAHQSPDPEMQSFITVASSMNHHEAIGHETSDVLQYPDFFEDIEAMNRYLW